MTQQQRLQRARELIDRTGVGNMMTADDTKELRQLTGWNEALAVQYVPNPKWPNQRRTLLVMGIDMQVAWWSWPKAIRGHVSGGRVDVITAMREAVRPQIDRVHQ